MAIKLSGRTVLTNTRSIRVPAAISRCASPATPSTADATTAQKAQVWIQPPKLKTSIQSGWQRSSLPDGTNTLSLQLFQLKRMLRGQILRVHARAVTSGCSRRSNKNKTEENLELSLFASWILRRCRWIMQALASSQTLATPTDAMHVSQASTSTAPSSANNAILLWVRQMGVDAATPLNV